AVLLLNQLEQETSKIESSSSTTTSNSSSSKSSCLSSSSISSMWSYDALELLRPLFHINQPNYNNNINNINNSNNDYNNEITMYHTINECHKSVSDYFFNEKRLENEEEKE